jgi:hypothetical protein
MPNRAARPLDGLAIRQLLSAVYQALDLPLPVQPWGRRAYLRLLEERAFIARVSVGRIVRNADSDELDYVSEGDHIRYQLAELPPSTYRHYHARH